MYIVYLFSIYPSIYLYPSIDTLIFMVFIFDSKFSITFNQKYSQRKGIKEVKLIYDPLFTPIFTSYKGAEINILDLEERLFNSKFPIPISFEILVSKY